MSFKCPRCRTPIHEHHAGECLDLWVTEWVLGLDVEWHESMGGEPEWTLVSQRPPDWPFAAAMGRHDVPRVSQSLASFEVVVSHYEQRAKAATGQKGPAAGSTMTFSFNTATHTWTAVINVERHLSKGGAVVEGGVGLGETMQLAGCRAAIILAGQEVNRLC